MVKSSPTKILRGQIWVGDLNPGFGRELRKTRPVLIISSNLLNEYSSTVVILPLTSQLSPAMSTKIPLEKAETGLKKDSAILVGDIRAIDKSRLIKKIGLISSEKIPEIEDVLKVVLGLTSLE